MSCSAGSDGLLLFDPSDSHGRSNACGAETCSGAGCRVLCRKLPARKPERVSAADGYIALNVWPNHSNRFFVGIQSIQSKFQWGKEMPDQLPKHLQGSIILSCPKY